MDIPIANECEWLLLAGTVSTTPRQKADFWFVGPACQGRLAAPPRGNPVPAIKSPPEPSASRRTNGTRNPPCAAAPPTSSAKKARQCAVAEVERVAAPHFADVLEERYVKVGILGIVPQRPCVSACRCELGLAGSSRERTNRRPIRPHTAQGCAP
jgi:hypothetical protein